MQFYQIFTILVIGYNTACAFMINVGTALFRYPEGDECCWLPSDVALLQTRMIFENLMPEPNLLNFVHDSCIIAVYDYFKLLADTVRCRKHKKTQRIFLYAMSDVIGGYIRHIIFPKLKFVFYAGYIDYRHIHKFQRMYFEIKILLRTNGKTWAKPIQTRVDFAAITDVLQNTKMFRNMSCLLINANIENVPLPFLDNDCYPTSIALPFRQKPLYNLNSCKSSYVLLKYYLNVVEILETNPVLLADFKHRFNLWLTTKILPLLRSEKIFFAFGGILQIISRMRRNDVFLQDVPKVKGIDLHNRFKKDMGLTKLIPVANDYQIDYSDGTIDSNYELNNEPKAYFVFHNYWLMTAFRIALIVVALLFIIVLIYFCCNRYRIKYQNLGKKPKSSPLDMYKMKTNASSDKSSSASEDDLDHNGKKKNCKH